MTDETDYPKFLPTRTGEAQGDATERVMLSSTGTAEISKRLLIHDDGSTTLLKKQFGRARFITDKPETPDIPIRMKVDALLYSDLRPTGMEKVTYTSYNDYMVVTGEPFHLTISGVSGKSGRCAVTSAIRATSAKPAIARKTWADSRTPPVVKEAVYTTTPTANSVPNRPNDNLIDTHSVYYRYCQAAGYTPPIDDVGTDSNIAQQTTDLDETALTPSTRRFAYHIEDKFTTVEVDSGYKNSDRRPMAISSRVIGGVPTKTYVVITNTNSTAGTLDGHVDIVEYTHNNTHVFTSSILHSVIFAELAGLGTIPSIHVGRIVISADGRGFAFSYAYNAGQTVASTIPAWNYGTNGWYYSGGIAVGSIDTGVLTRTNEDCVSRSLVGNLFANTDVILGVALTSPSTGPSGELKILEDYGYSGTTLKHVVSRYTYTQQPSPVNTWTTTNGYNTHAYNGSSIQKAACSLETSDGTVLKTWDCKEEWVRSENTSYDYNTPNPGIQHCAGNITVSYELNLFDVDRVIGDFETETYCVIFKYLHRFPQVTSYDWQVLDDTWSSLNVNIASYSVESGGWVSLFGNNIEAVANSFGFTGVNPSHAYLGLAFNFSEFVPDILYIPRAGASEAVGLTALPVHSENVMHVDFAMDPSGKMGIFSCVLVQQRLDYATGGVTHILPAELNDISAKNYVITRSSRGAPFTLTPLVLNDYIGNKKWMFALHIPFAKLG